MVINTIHQLHIVCGLPASGKTTFGLQLAKKLGATFIDSDTATDKVIQAAHRAAGYDPHDRDSLLYKQTYREPVYDTLFDLAAQNLTHVDVVIAGPFTAELRDQEAWQAWLNQRFCHKVRIYHQEVPEDVRLERMKQRGAKRDLGKSDLAKTLCETIEFSKN